METKEKRTYRIRLVCERGPDPLTGEVHERAEEVVEVEAESLWRAYRRATARMTMSPMGRLLKGFDAETGERAEPPPPEPYRRGLFDIDSLRGPYEGYTDGETWNGWATPRFERSVAERIARDYVEMGREITEEDGHRAWYDAEADAFVFYEPANDDEAAYGATEIKVDGAAITVYPVGTAEWTWEERVVGHS